MVSGGCLVSGFVLLMLVSTFVIWDIGIGLELLRLAMTLAMTLFSLMFRLKLLRFAMTF